MKEDVLIAIEKFVKKIRLEKRNTGYPTDIGWDEAVDSLNQKIAQALKEGEIK